MHAIILKSRNITQLPSSAVYCTPIICGGTPFFYIVSSTLSNVDLKDPFNIMQINSPQRIEGIETYLIANINPSTHERNMKNYDEF